MSESAAASNSIHSQPGSLELVLAAARDGAADANEAAARVWSRTSLYLARAAYVTAYGISFGVVFPAALVAHGVPRDNAAVRGLIEGAQAARQKVDALIDRRQVTSVVS